MKFLSMPTLFKHFSCMYNISRFGQFYVSCLCLQSTLATCLIMTTLPIKMLSKVNTEFHSNSEVLQQCNKIFHFKQLLAQKCGFDSRIANHLKINGSFSNINNSGSYLIMNDDVVHFKAAMKFHCTEHCSHFKVSKTTEKTVLDDLVLQEATCLALNSAAWVRLARQSNASHGLNSSGRKFRFFLLLKGIAYEATRSPTVVTQQQKKRIFTKKKHY